ncbi:HAD-IIB family hydrolase [Paenibacillus sp. CMAA1364]
MKFVFDLDGTICFKGQPISQRLVQRLELLMVEGHEVIFASARPIRDMLPVVDSRFHNHILIGGNGSLVSIEGQLVHVNSFTIEQIQLIMELVRSYEATYLIDSDWNYAYNGAIDHPILNNVDSMKLAEKVSIDTLGNIVKILILSATNLERLSEELLKLDVVVHKHKDEQLLDISPKNIHKWSALQRVGVEEQQFIAFGNDANDISMFQKAVYSIRIGHHPELGKYATKTISLEANVEQCIINTIDELSERRLR